MRLLPDQLAARWRRLVSEFAKFGTIGVVNAILNYAVFNALILTVFAQSQLKANVIATVVATTASYFMNRHWTFRDRPRSTLRREYVLFFAFNLAGLAMELSVMALAKYGLGLTGVLALNVAKTFGVGLGTIFRFWAYRTFVFRPVVVEAGAPSAAPASEVDFAELEAEFAIEAELDSLAPEPETAHRRL